MDDLIRELKKSGVLKSPAIESAFRAIDRKYFVPPELAKAAYADHPLPIGAGQTISQPWTVAFMLELASPKPGERVLEIGAGSGWQTALLAKLVGNRGRIFAIERIPELFEFGRKNLAQYEKYEKNIGRLISLACADGTVGLPDAAPFDLIIAAASAEGNVPEAWRTQTKIGGRIIAPVGNDIVRLTKLSANRWEEERFPGFAFVPLVAGKPGSEIKPRSLENKTAEIRRTNTSKHWRLWVLGCVTALVLATAYCPTFARSGGRAIAIAPGMGARAIGNILAEEKIIRSKWAFLAYAAITGTLDDLKPGRYQFFGVITIPKIVTSLTTGAAREHEITIREGWDLRDIANYFEREGIARPDELFAITGEPARRYGQARAVESALREDFPLLSDKPDSVGLEGYLYPDTYRIFSGAGIEEVVRKMLANFDAHITPELREEIIRQQKSIFEIITVASLIEKEIPHEEDRRVVSGIIWRRLSLGMPLQIDSSVNYATGAKRTPRAVELTIDSPFNTYRFPGLPAGPIANPGEDAIRAAIFPASSPYLYYLSAPGGQTIFSRTLEEHATAKRRYLSSPANH